MAFFDDDFETKEFYEFNRETLDEIDKEQRNKLERAVIDDERDEREGVLSDLAELRELLRLTRRQRRVQHAVYLMQYVAFGSGDFLQRAFTENGVVAGRRLGGQRKAVKERPLKDQHHRWINEQAFDFLSKSSQWRALGRGWKLAATNHVIDTLRRSPDKLKKFWKLGHLTNADDEKRIRSFVRKKFDEDALRVRLGVGAP
jgi:hypothetical protein